MTQYDLIVTDKHGPRSVGSTTSDDAAWAWVGGATDAGESRRFQARSAATPRVATFDEQEDRAAQLGRHTGTWIVSRWPELCRGPSLGDGAVYPLILAAYEAYNLAGEVRADHVDAFIDHAYGPISDFVKSCKETGNNG